MSDKVAFTMAHPRARQNAADFLAKCPDRWRVQFSPPKRSDRQSDKMHAMASDVSKQVVWCGMKLSKDDWKRMATATLNKLRVVPGVNEDGQPGGGVIVLGVSTSDMGVAEMGEMIEWFYWFGAIHNVVWGDEVGEKT